MGQISFSHGFSWNLGSGFQQHFSFTCTKSIWVLNVFELLLIRVDISKAVYMAFLHCTEGFFTSVETRCKKSIFIFITFSELLHLPNATTSDMERTRTRIDNTCQQCTFWEAGRGVNWEWRNLESGNWMLGSSIFIRNPSVIVVFVISSAVIQRRRGWFPITKLDTICCSN